MRNLRVWAPSAVFCAMLMSSASSAGPWTEMGDAGLRSDIELLESAGVLDSIGTHWPLPWAGIMDRLNDPSSLSGKPAYIIAAAQRVRQRGKADTATGTTRASILLDGATNPAVVRGYDALGRQTLLAQASLEHVWNDTVINVKVGARSTTKNDGQKLALDGSYIAQRIDGTVVYAGYLSHWWGGGSISALSLSNNARPFPQVGISRISTAPLESPWLNWVGPWQVEFFVGVLDGPRVARHTIYDGTRIVVSPLPGLEIGASRTDEMCGSGHVCKPITGFFNVNNNATHNDYVNDQSSLDIRYTGSFHSWNYAAYMQTMNEDTNMFHWSGTSHLFGASLWRPIGSGVGRLLAEYTDTTASRDIFGGPAMHGFAYNNGDYNNNGTVPDAMRYRGRTLGFSLDSDSRLISLQGSYVSSDDWNFALTYHRAKISDPLNTWFNVVSRNAVKMNVVQARVSMPLQFSQHGVHLDLEGRYQDDQPRPDKGKLVAVEAALRFDL